MSETLYDVQDEYSNLKQRIKKMEFPAMPGLAAMTPVTSTLKIIAEEPKEYSNNAHIAYNADFIANVSRSALTPVLEHLSKEELDPIERQKVEGIRSEVTAMHNDAMKLVQQSEKYITPDDVSDEVGDFITAASYSQIISAEIKEVGEELNGEGDAQKLNECAESIQKKAEELGKPAGRVQSFAWKFKEAAKNFREALKNGLKSLTGKIGGIKDVLAKLLKIAADLLHEFFARLISAFFGFASWVQKIALKNNFSLNELSFELPSFEFNIMMIGPYPLPVPKLTTPKLTAKFVPGPILPKTP